MGRMAMARGASEDTPGLLRSAPIRCDGFRPFCPTSARARIRAGVCRWALLALVPAAIATPACGQEALYWDVNGTSIGEGGSATWTLSDPRWSLSTDGVSGPYRTWDNLALNDAFFRGTAGTVTLAQPIRVHNITFATNGYIITGNTLTLDGVDPTLSVTTGASTIASTITGTGRVIKAGGGTLTLSGNNSFNGGLTVSAGTLFLTGNNSFGSGPVITGGALSLTGTNSFVGDISVNGTLTASGAAALGTAGNNITISGGSLNIGATGGTLTGRTVTLSGVGRVNISGAGIGGAHFTGTGGLAVSAGVNLTDDSNNYSGSTAFNGAGGSTFSSIGNLGETSSLGAPNTVADGTIVISNPSGTTGTRSVSYVGDGDVSNRNWSLTANGYRGVGLTNSGTGTLTLTGAIGVNRTSLAQTPAFTAQTADLELLGVISGNDVAFNANAGLVLRLGDANTFASGSIGGAGKVEAATLTNVGVASSLGTGGGTGISGTLSYVGAGASTNRAWGLTGTLSNDGTGALTLSGGTSLSGTGTLGGSFTGADNVISGVISGAGNLRGAGAGTWLVSGANTYTGQTIVDSGTLRAGSATAFASSKTFQVNGGTLDLNDFNQTLSTLTGTGGTLDLGSALLTIEAPTGTTASFAGSIVGSGGLTKLGASTQTLTGASTYTGATTIGGGILNLDFSPVGGPAGSIIGGGSTLNMAGGRLNIIGAAGESNIQTFNGLNITAGNNIIDAQSGIGGSLTVNLGAINRTGGLMNFNLPTGGNITTTNTSLGGWATVNGTDYAKVVGGNILAFVEADYTDKDNAADWLDNEFITDVTGFFGTVTGTKQLGGLRYTQPVSTTVTVSPGETLGVDGTIIVAPTVLATNQLITGGMMTGANGGVLGVQQNSSGNFTIASRIVDNGPGMGFTKAGTGLVTLSNTGNSYTGATRVVQGTLAVTSIGNGGAASSIGASSADPSNLVLEASTLRYTGAGDTSDRGFTFAKSGAITGSGVEVTNAGANLTFGGLVTSSDGANFTKTGAGTLTLANDTNDFTGIVTVSGGLLAADTLADGGLVSGIGRASSASANLVLAGGGLQYTGGTASTNRGFTLGAGNGTVDVANAATTLTVSGTAVGAGRLFKAGSGTLILSGTNSYTGGNTVNAGILRAGSTQAFGLASGSMTLANTAGVLLDLNGLNNAVGPLSGGGASGGNVTLGSATLTINGGGGNYSGVISGTGGVTRTGGGTQTFNGCNNVYTGPTSLQGATLNVDCLANGGAASGIGASGSASTNLIFNNGGLNYTGSTVTIDRGFQLAGGASTIGVISASTTLEFTGAIVGGGSLNKAGAGTLVLSGTNSSTGNKQVSEGVLRAARTNAFGPQGVMTLNNTAGVLLDLDGFDTLVTSLNGGGAIGGNISLGDAVLTIINGGHTYAGAISGTGSLIKNGTADQALSGCNSSYTGSTTINGGTLLVTCLENGGVNSSIGASSSDPANLVINGSILRYVGTGDSTDRQFTLGAGGGTLDASGSGAVAFTYAGPLTLAGPATARKLTLTGANAGENIFSAQLGDSSAGATALAKTGTGTWRLTNQASNYTGATTINGGILIVDKLADGGADSSIGASSSVMGNLVIGNGSTFRYVGTGDTTDRQFTLDTGVTYIQASGTGALVFDNVGAVGLTGTNATRTIALGGTNTDLNTMGGAIGDNGTGATTLAKNDSGTWVLTGNNSFTGNTVINNGNLMIGNGGTTGNAGAGNVIVDSPTSTLSLNRSDSFTFGGTLSGPGTLAQIGAGTSILTSASNSIGAATIGAGALQVDGGLTTPTIAMTGTSALTVNGTVRAAGGTAAALTGDAGASTIIVNAGATLAANGDLGDGGDTVSLAGTLATGGGAMSLGLGDDTLILRDGGAITGIGVQAGTGADALLIDNALAYTLDGASISGFESLAKQNGGVLTLTGAHGYSAGTTIAAGTLRIGNGGLSGTLAGDIANDSVLAFNRAGTLAIAGQISGTGSVNQLGPGTTVLTAGNSYLGGTTITAGTLQIGDGGTGGSITGNVANNATLAFNRSDDVTFAGLISGTGALRQLGAGRLTLTADNSYVGLTTIAAGTLQLGNGGTSGRISGNILNNGALAFNRSDIVTFGGAIFGTGSVMQTGSGATILTGPNSYSGATNVTAGTLLVNGNQSGAMGLTSVASGATLGGAGTIGGDVEVADGGTLAPGSGGAGALTINGGLSLAGASRLAFQFGQANAPGDPLNDIVNVGGDLTLDGTIDVAVSPGGSFDIGLYRVFNYGGTLTDNGLAIGTTPPGSDMFVQTAVGGQVNLINTAGAMLNFWDGAAGPKFDNSVNGGDGIWQNGSGNDNWADISGAVNAPYSDGAIAIFSAAPGNVIIDNGLGAVTAAGMQFASDGYTVTGGALTLSAAQSVIRVGDGTAAGAGYTATIGSALTGAAQLVKTDLGTLILAGTNSYTGGTLIDEGTLSISSDANLGDAAGALSLDGATLGTTADIVSGRAINLLGGGTFDVNAATTLTLTGVVSGAGGLSKDGDGALILAADNSYGGGTSIDAGILQLGNGGTTGSITGDVVNNGTLAFNRSDSATFAGTISGAGEVSQRGTGTTILTADNSYTGGTTISAGTLQFGDGGTTGSIVGDILNNGALVFNRADTVTFAGLISGTGGIEQSGAGTTILTGGNSYAGATMVSAGTLIINGDQSAATGATSVASGATLGGTGTLGGNVAIADGGAINPGGIGGAPGVLAIAGNLDLAPAATLNYYFGQANVAGGALNDLVDVGGDLVLGGTLNVTASGGGSFDPGIYRVINYSGTLANNGLVIGTIPSGTDFYVQTSVANQVNLINTDGLALRFWDGASGGRNDGIITGGDGVWQNVSGNDNWTLDDASINAPFLDSAFAIFSGAAGTVTVDEDLGAINVSGMQFATDGYVIAGDPIHLAGAPASVIRVGDGTATGAGVTATIASDILGTSQLVKTDLGALILTGSNSYSGGTAINGGALGISSDANLGDATGTLSFAGGTLNTTADIVSNRAVSLTGDGIFETNAGTSLTLNGAVAGAGLLTKDGAGSLVLTGANSYGGDTIVTAGSLFVNGDQTGATGLTSVASGATLGGSGIIGGNVTLADGATLAAGTNNVGTLAINGNLALSGGSVLDFAFGEANVAGGALNDLVMVGGDLILDGTINVSVPVGGSFGPGIYRAFNYGGALTDNGLTLGTLPGGSAVSVQTAIAGQVNLVNTAGLTLSFWDGTVGPKNNGAVNGGDGVWRVAGGSNNWTEASGAINADYAQGSFAIFSATPGTVSIDNSGGNVLASGMQFASDGYVITGDPLTLTGAQAIVQVGDGSAASAGYTATIDAELAGSAGVVKTDAGTLVLTGTNSYAGGTTISGGTLQIGNGGATGSIAGDIANNAALVVNRSGTIALDGTISGTGSLTKTGGGVLTLSGTNSYAGGTLVDAGTVQITSDANLGDVAGTLSLQGGALQAGAAFTSAHNILLGSTDSNRIDTQGFDVTLTGTIGNGPNNGSGNFLDKLGSGTLTLTGANTYANRTLIAGGTLALAGAGTIGAGNLIVGSGTVFDISQTTTGARVIQLGGAADGTIALGSKTLAIGFGNSFTDWAGSIADGGIGGGTGGSVVIAAPNGAVRYFGATSYTGGTTVAAGSFELVGNGALYSQGAVTVNGGGLFNIAGIAAAGTTIGDLSGAGTVSLGGKSLTFGTANDTVFSGPIAGSGGALVKQGAGTFTLGGANSYTGATDVLAGTLLVTGNQSAATGLTSVASGATLGGTGTIGGNVIIADGATLAPGAGGPGALTINGGLTLSVGSTLAYEFGAANAVGSPLNDVVNIGGDLTLDGTINVAVTPGGAFDIGLYRIANYGGLLTDNGLALGTLPAGADVFVQTSVANQVNLINTGSATLNFWDGAAGPKFNGAVNGGDGIWQNSGGNDNWADATGAVNAPFDDSAFAIFTGTAGTVIIDNSLGAVSASGLQFAVDGYAITGEALTLAGPQSVIRVGDGTAAGAGYTATIGSDISGTTQLVKTDLGTLVLTGTNSYTGGTAINGGTLRIASDANLGAAAGGLIFSGSTLNTTASFGSDRAIDLAGAGTFLTDAGTTLDLGGAFTGAGSLTKSGAGTLLLSGTGSYAGATSVGAGMLLVNGNYGGATGPVTVASGASLGGNGTIGGNVALADGAILTPGAGGAGTLTIAGDLSLAAGTRLAYQFGQAGVAGGALNDLVNVGGDLILDGTIDVTVPSGGAFDVGVYRMFNYGGALTDNGLAIGTLPGGGTAAVQTSIAGQVNLVNSAGLLLNFWDGAAGPKNDGVINGGNGIWQSRSGNDNWTDANGTVNAAYSDSAFAIFGGTGGTVTVDNSLGNVIAAGMQFAANGYTISGNPVALTGPQSTIRVGDGTTAGAGFTSTINAALSGDTQLVKTDAGTLILGGTNSYTGGTRVSGGTVQVSADANLGAATGGVTLDGGTLATSASMTSARGIVMAGAGTIRAASDTMFTFNGLLSGAGALTKAGTGTLLVAGDNSGYTGATTVAAGTLAVTGTLGGAVTVTGGSRLEGTGRVGNLTNAGTVAPGRDGFGTLTVNGSYTGNNGTLDIEAVLGGDASQTDRLVVTNGTSGATVVHVTNRGGLGAQTTEGIKLIDVTGGTSAGTFALDGDYLFGGEQAVIAGAYGYRLYQGGTSTPTDGDWYLRSALLNPITNQPNAPLYQPGVPVYEAYAATLQALNGLPTLQQRIGNRSWAAGANPEGGGIWGRMETTRNRINAVVSTSFADQDTDSWKMQVGADHVLAATGKGERLVAGVTAHYGEANSQVRSIFGGGSLKTQGYGVGATLTWYGLKGFYIDGQAQLSRYDSDLNSHILGQLAQGNDGDGEAFSLELGKRTSVAPNLSITPQIQMVYSNVRFERFTDPAGATIAADKGDSLKSRWGITLDHQSEWAGGRTHLYGLVNLNYEWLGASRVRVSGTPIDHANARLSGELGIGGSVSWRNGVTLYSEISANSPVKDFGDSLILKANAGIRVVF